MSAPQMTEIRGKVLLNPVRRRHEMMNSQRIKYHIFISYSNDENIIHIRSDSRWKSITLLYFAIHASDLPGF